MRLIVNGEERDVRVRTLAELWREEARALELPGPEGFAIALNGEVAPRSEWDATELSEGDEVEIIRAMQGG